MKVKDEKLFGASDKVYADSKAKGLYNESQDILDTLKQRKNAIIRMITKYNDLKDDAKVKEYEDKLREVERRIDNYSNSDKPMKMQEADKEDFESDMAHIEEFLNTKDGYATPEAEQILDTLYDDFITLSSKVHLDESADYPEDEKVTESKELKESYYVKIFNSDDTDIDTYETNDEQEAIDYAENQKANGYRAVVYNADTKEALYDYDPNNVLEEDAWDDNFVINMLTDEKVYWKRKSDGKEIVTSFDIFKEPTDSTEWKSEEELTKYALEEGKIILSNLDVAEKVFEGIDIDEELVEETKTSDKLFDQLKELGMTKEQAESTVKAIVNIFKNKSPEIVKESVEDVLDNLSNETVDKVSDIISKIKNLGWDGNIDTIEDYFDKALAKVEESKKLNESNAEDFIKDVEDAKLLGWDGKDETFKDYMKKVNDMRQVNKELKKENNEENTNKLKDINFKQWYMENVPEDNFLFDDLRDDTTFQDILDTLKAGNNVYDAMFKEGKGGDSTVRENVFSALSDMLNVDYDDVYYLWLYPERDNKLKENKEIKKEAVEKINDEEGKELVKKYYPEATDEQAEKIVDMWNNDNGAINPEEEFAFSTMEKWLQVSEKNGYALEDMLVESKITEADEKFKETIYEVAEYLYNESEQDLDYIPEIEDIQDRVNEDCDENMYNKAVDIVRNIIENITYYEYDYKKYIQLSDNHTMYELNDDVEMTADQYSSLVDIFLQQLQDEINIDIYALGRSGRHICIDNTFDNALNYNGYVQAQRKYEQEMINYINQEYGNNKTENKKLNEDIKSNKYEIEWNAGAVERTPTPNETIEFEGTRKDLMQFLDDNYVDIDYDDNDNIISFEKWLDEYEEMYDPSGSTVVLSIKENGKEIYKNSDYDYYQEEQEDYEDYDGIEESKHLTEAEEDIIEQNEEETDNNILDLLQNRIGQNLTVGELNTILQGVLGKYNEVYLLTSDLYNMNPEEPQELVVFDDDDMYTITYNIEDMDNAIIQITDVELD